MRRSHMPICFSASVPVHPDTDGPVYALPANKYNQPNEFSIEFRMDAQHYARCPDQIGVNAKYTQTERA